MLKNNMLFMKLLRWDIKPEDLFKPRFTDLSRSAETNGFMFYIEYVRGVKPHLSVMRTVDLVSSTYGEVECDIPEEMIMDAIKKSRGISGMHPIDKEIEEWLKRELGIG
jgi:hypothetical protein